MTAGKLLGGGSHHLLPADNAHVVGLGQLLSGGVWVKCVHIMDCASGENHIIEGFLESSHSEVHRAHSEERQGVDSDHDNKEKDVEQNLDETNEKFSVQHKNGLVLPRILTVKVDGMQDILDKGIDYDGEKDGIFKPEHQLYTSSLSECRCIGVLDEK